MESYPNTHAIHRGFDTSVFYYVPRKMLSQERPKAKYTQSIEELLGLPAKSSMPPSSLDNIVERPSTRHGRRESHKVPPKTQSTPSSESSASSMCYVVETWSAPDAQTEEQEVNLERIDSNRSLVPTIKTNANMHAVHRNRRGSLTTASSRGSSDSSKENKKVIIPTLEVSNVHEPSVSVGVDKTTTHRKSSPTTEHLMSGQRQRSLPPSRISDFVSSTAMNTGGSNSHKIWLDAKIKERREIQRRLNDKEEEERKKQIQRKDDAKRSFEMWKHRQDEKLRAEKKRQKQFEDEKRKKDKEEKLRKHEEAGKVFEAWKRERSITQSYEMAKKEEKKRKQAAKTNKEKEQRQLESDEALATWLENKRLQDDMRKRLKVLELEEKQKKEHQERSLKEALASEAYNVWLDMKEKEKEFTKTVANRILTYEEEAKKRWPTPWLPPSNTVPRHFVSAGNRRKSLDPRRTVRRARSTRAPRSTSVH
ncbi:hypothetical protein QR680_003458 [Steinernema hermaphroditum]|uniref:Uncharacterized protein n=1 Tax=Steinernema hermaphroditum TaxID=289476 RepID=A0AA39H7V7_9BILA|nr:hypothetical protein QR680_003458 [Steinernema hermaphroditum]